MSGTVLDIDVAEELRAVSSSQLRATWQLPAELVRLAVRLGGRRVELERRRRGFVLRCEGAVVDEERVADLATALDAAQAPDARHRSIVRVEEAGIQALLWAAGMRTSRLRVESSGSGRWARLSRGRGRTLTVETASAGAGEEWLEVHLLASSFDGRRAASWLRLAARFCPVPVVVDGVPAQGTFDSALLESCCQHPVPARLAVTLTGDAPRLWLLRHGVLATQATVPGWPPFSAAVELGGLVREQASPDELLEAARPHLEGLAQRAVDMVLAASDDMPHRAEETRQRLVCVLLRAVRVGLRRERILETPLLRTVGGGGDGGLLSVKKLGELTAAGSRVVVVVEPGGPAAPDGSGAPLTLALTPEERLLLGELPGLRLDRPAAPATTRHPWCGRARAMCSRLHPGRWWPVRRRIVPSDELLQAELGLLALLNAQLAPPVEARLCAGGGPVLRRGNRLLLPRQNPLVVRALRLTSADRTWLYPVALALLGDEARPSPELRTRWRRRCLELSGDGAPPAAGAVEAG